MLKHQVQRQPRSLLSAASLCFSLLVVLLFSGMYALTFPMRVIMEIVVKTTLFVGGGLGFILFWGFLKEYLSLLQFKREFRKFLFIKIRFISELFIKKKLTKII